MTNTIFELTDEQEEKARKFIDKHKKCVYKSTFGGKISYEFCPTSVGIMCIIKCDKCKKTEDISDYDLW